MRVSGRSEQICTLECAITSLALRDHISETQSAASDAAVLSYVAATEEDFRAKAIEFVRPP